MHACVYLFRILFGSILRFTVATVTAAAAAAAAATITLALALTLTLFSLLCNSTAVSVCLRHLVGNLVF